MDVIPLGSGQEVGRSCVVVSIKNKTIMFDCGIHMGFNDKRRFPDFSCISRTGNFDRIIDCVIISHCHLDHCGALPYFTEVLGYAGPIYMTHPTKAIIPLLLDDFLKVLELKPGEGAASYRKEDVSNCIKKITGMAMHQTIEIEPGFTIAPYYAGHVLGAAMFHVTVGNQSVVYTGDFSTVTEAHLKPAYIDCIRPDLLITESTYGGVVRERRLSKERKFLQLIEKHLAQDGRVLIPIFALGRAQELCLLLESHWEENSLNSPIYFAGQLIEKANSVYRRFINYTTDKLKNQFQESNPFDFKHIKPYRDGVEKDAPCVIFASPGMLHSGMSLTLFKRLCSSPRNLLILSGYCARGTYGEQVLRGDKEITINGLTKQIRMKVVNLAFSAHADTFGINKIIRMCQPKLVMLVHGDPKRMRNLSSQIEDDLNIPVIMPPNGTMYSLPPHEEVEISVDRGQLAPLIKPHKAEQSTNLQLKIRATSHDALEAVSCQKFLLLNQARTRTKRMRSLKIAIVGGRPLTVNGGERRRVALRRGIKTVIRRATEEDGQPISSERTKKSRTG